MSLSFRRVGANLGAEVSGADLAGPLDGAVRDAILDGLAEHELLIFRNQKITAKQLIAFGEALGELSVHPFAPHVDGTPALIRFENNAETPPFGTDVWHSDETFRAVPPMATALYAKAVPEVGGDTVFASMSAAYEGLSARTRAFIDGLEAVHDIKPFRPLFSDTPEDRRSLRRFEEIYPANDAPGRAHPSCDRPAGALRQPAVHRPDQGYGRARERLAARHPVPPGADPGIPVPSCTGGRTRSSCGTTVRSSIMRCTISGRRPASWSRVTIKGTRPVGVEAADPATVQRPKTLITGAVAHGAHRPHLVEDDIGPEAGAAR